MRLFLPVLRRNPTLLGLHINDFLKISFGYLTKWCTIVFTAEGGEGFPPFIQPPHSWQRWTDSPSFIGHSGEGMSVCPLGLSFLIQWHLMEWCFSILKHFIKCSLWDDTHSLFPFEYGINLYPKKNKCPRS